MNTQVLPEATTLATEEPCIVLDGVSWEQYDALVRAFIDRFPALRMTYLEGRLTIMTTSSDRERLKTLIGRLVEVYAEVMDIDLNGYGSATFRKEAKQGGLEPDECYCIGELKEFPDLAIEVIITSGKIDEKLAIYRGLEVSEVWFWKKSRFFVYRLEPKGYDEVSRSTLLPELDFSLLAGYANWTSQTKAAKAYRAALEKNAS